MTEKFDVHQAVTDSIVRAIEAGPGTWTMPWQRSGLANSLPRNALTQASYNGLNVVSLWCAAAVREYRHSIWATYKQWTELGAQVRKGEKSSVVIFYKQYETEPKPDVADDDGIRRVARASWVFNAAQVDGFTVDDSAAVDMGPVARHAAAESMIAAHAMDVRYGGDMAYYSPRTDHIQLPEDTRFTGDDRTEAFYSVLFHEAGHWTGVKSRCDRDMTGRFGSDSYAMEELVAELTASFLCAEFGISAEPRPDHASYIGHWLKVLKADKRAVFTAAAKAAEAARYLRSKGA